MATKNPIIPDDSSWRIQNPTAPKGFPDVDLWCIQVIAGPEKEVLEEWFVNPRINLQYKFPKHGSKHPFWKKIEPTAKYHLTPFSKLDRADYLAQGKIIIFG